MLLTSSLAAVGAASGGNSGAVAAGVSVSLSVVLLVVIVLGLLFLIVRWKRGSVPSPNKSSGVREDGTKVNSDEAEIDSRSRGNSITVTTKSHTEVQPLGNGQSVYVDVNNSIVVSLPPPNTRSSIVDADMHELPSRLQEPPNLPLRAQSAAARTLESNDVTV